MVKLLRTTEAAAVLNLRPQTLRALRQKGSGPVFTRIARNRVAYSETDLTAWVEARRFPSNAAAREADRRAAK